MGPAITGLELKNDASTGPYALFSPPGNAGSGSPTREGAGTLGIPAMPGEAEENIIGDLWDNDDMPLGRKTQVFDELAESLLRPYDKNARGIRQRR